MSDHHPRLLRHALKQVAVTGVTGSLLLGTAVAGLAAPPGTTTVARATTVSTTAATSVATSVATAPVTLHTQPVAARKKRHVDVGRMMRQAARLKGRPYRWGATGPRAFDCSGYTLYVLKKQGIKIPRTAAQQYGRTKHIRKSRVHVGDLIFFYGRGGIYHVGIYAGHHTMWHAPHSGDHVRKARIYSSNIKVGRLA